MVFPSSSLSPRNARRCLEIVRAYAPIDVFSHSQGIDMGKNDLWIAATASVTGATLLTTDKDFDHLESAFLTRIWIDPCPWHANLRIEPKNDTDYP